MLVISKKHPFVNRREVCWSFVKCVLAWSPSPQELRLQRCWRETRISSFGRMCLLSETLPAVAGCRRGLSVPGIFYLHRNAPEKKIVHDIKGVPRIRSTIIVTIRRINKFNSTLFPKLKLFLSSLRSAANIITKKTTKENQAGGYNKRKDDCKP